MDTFFKFLEKFIQKIKKVFESILSISLKNKPIAKKEKASDKKFTFQFKKAVSRLDLNLTSDENKEQNNMTASQKRELTLNLNALKELLDGDYISKEQHDVKEKELKAIYD